MQPLYLLLAGRDLHACGPAHTPQHDTAQFLLPHLWMVMQSAVLSARGRKTGRSSTLASTPWQCGSALHGVNSTVHALFSARAHGVFRAAGGGRTYTLIPYIYDTLQGC
jgi:hypothetical protein